jgi:hypothetical protein
MTPCFVMRQDLQLVLLMSPPQIPSRPQSLCIHTSYCGLTLILLTVIAVAGG